MQQAKLSITDKYKLLNKPDHSNALLACRFKQLCKPEESKTWSLKVVMSEAFLVRTSHVQKQV